MLKCVCEICKTKVISKLLFIAFDKKIIIKYKIDSDEVLKNL